jgi:geranylgeranyl diphosphate synthase type I
MSSDLAVLKDQFEVSLKQFVLDRAPESLPGLREMVSYHFGWNDPSSKAGKRLRPMLLLTSSEFFGHQPVDLMPAAVAMEVLHNYTLVHDDIEDQGQTRFGRECMWRRYGLAQALNVGDFLSMMAYDIFHEVLSAVDPADFAKAYSIFCQATLDVFRGQYLDMYFETEKSVSVDQYLEMIRLKTSRLISASMRIGAILAGADEAADLYLEEIGEHAGLAFQIQDDYLGIWGDTASTGKSNLTDLTTRKKTYPILLGLAESVAFKAAWETNPQITPDLARQLAGMLSEAGIDEKTNDAVLKHLRLIREGKKRLANSNDNHSTAMWDLLNSAFMPTFASTLNPNAPT